MSWIKRNLGFVIGSFVALVLMGLAGWYLYSKWNLNNSIVGQLDEQYAELDRLNKLNPPREVSESFVIPILVIRFVFPLPSPVFFDIFPYTL